MKSSLSLRLLIWFILLSLLPLIIFAFHTYQENANKIHESVLSKLSESSRLQKRYIENWFNYRYSDISSWSQSMYSKNFMTYLIESKKQSSLRTKDFIKSYPYTRLVEQFEKEFINIKKNYEHVHDILFIDKDGDILYSVSKESDLGTNIVKGIYSSTRFCKTVKETIDDKGVHYSDIEYYEPSESTLASFLTAPLFDERGNFMGVFVIQLKLYNLFSIFNFKEGYKSYIVGEDNLLRTDISKEKRALDFKVDPSMFMDTQKSYLSDLDKHFSGIRNRINIFGVEWVLINEVQGTIALESKKEFATSLFMFLFFLSIIIFIVARYISLQITRPLKMLVEASLDISKGKREPLEYSGEDDEVGKLSAAFNKMIESLANNEYLLVKKSKELAFSKEELQEYTHKLEERITHEVRLNSLQQRQLFNQTRLAQMGEMISMIAHQWRQPLGAIASTAIDLKLQLELEKFDLSSPQERESCQNYFTDSLASIELFTKNLTTTIDDFRDFYKPNKEVSLVEIQETIKKVLSIADSSLKTHNITLHQEYSNSKKINIYENEIMQVLLNILTNAKDNFILKNIENATIWISVLDTKDGIRLEILDNGGGVDYEIIEKIFDPYFSTKHEKNGTGLGLYMSKIIIQEHHNGTISAKNIDAGVSFTIELKEEL